MWKLLYYPVYIYSKEMIAGTRTAICTPKFIAALFTIARRLKQPKRPLVERWRNKMCYILMCQGCCDDTQQTSWLQQKCIFSQLWRLESKTKVPSGLFSGETPLFGLQIAPFSLCLSMTFPLCTCRERSWCPFLHKDTNPMGLKLHFMTLFSLDDLHKGLVSNCSHIETWGFNTGIGGERGNSVHNNIQRTIIQP